MHTQVKGIALLLGCSEAIHFPDNPLQIAVLNLFVSLKSRFPNLVIGAITRESVKKALANGITADQVCTALMSSTLLHPVDEHCLDHNLSYDTRTPPNAQKRESRLCHWSRGTSDDSTARSGQKPLLPVTVQDQVRLWELEKNRVKSEEGYLMSLRIQGDIEIY